MNLNAYDIDKIIGDLSSTVFGSKVQQVYQPLDDRIVLELRRPGATIFLLVCIGEGIARLHLLSEKPENPPEPPNFCARLRKHLEHARLAEIRRLPDDRIVRMSFESTEGNCRLFAELFGRPGLFILTDEENRMIGTHPPAPPVDRALSPGAYYTPPTPNPSLRERSVFEIIQPSAGENLSNALEKYYCENEKTEILARARNHVSKMLRDDIKKAAKLIDKLEVELQACEESDKFLQKGELLKANLGVLKRGMSNVKVNDFYSETGEEVEITLDPTKTPRENMDALFKKQRKLKRGADAVAMRMEMIKDRKAKMEVALNDLEIAADSDEVAEIENRFYRRRPQINFPSKKPKQQQGSGGPRRFVSQEGYEILVGRNNRENDELTIRYAKSNDLFFHVGQYTGSHVIVKVPQGQNPSLDTLIDAGTLAVYYSKARGRGRVEVHYAPRKFVTKPKSMAPGAVLLHQHKALNITPDKKRLERILSSAGIDADKDKE